MNAHLRTLAQRASREIDLTYPGDAFPGALTKLIVKDLIDDLNKVKWLGEDPGWDKAMDAIKKELKQRYGV